MKVEKTKPTSIRLPQDIEIQIKKLADQNMRSVSKEILYIIKKYLEENAIPH